MNLDSTIASSKRRVWEPLPSDLVVVMGLAALGAAFTLVMPLADLPLRAPVGLVLAIFLPGYALMAALFPRRGLNGLLRAALSVTSSLFVALAIRLLLNFSSWGLRLGPIVAFLILVTLILPPNNFSHHTRDFYGFFI